MTVAEFDYQWSHLPSANTEYTAARVTEFLKLTKLPREFFWGKKCLDAGCGNGRWTYAMQYLGAYVDSFDISPVAVKQCQKVNPGAQVADVYDLSENRAYDFVLSWGVLHHLPNPELGFMHVAKQVRPGGTLHVMVYHERTQRIYVDGRAKWAGWTENERLEYCRHMVTLHGGDIHGWWDAFNPTYNFSYTPKQIRAWFEGCGFRDVKLTQKYSINMRGVYRE